MTVDSDSEAAPLHLLLENHRAFLAFLERRVHDRALAEDILQEAFSKVLERPEGVPDEGVVPWFYRTLRNAAIDRFRRQGAASQALERFAREIETSVPPPEIEREICACVSKVAATLKPEYAEALTAIDIGGTSVKTSRNGKGCRQATPACACFAHARRFANACSSRAAHAPSTGVSTAAAERAAFARRHRTPVEPPHMCQKPLRRSSRASAIARSQCATAE